MSQPTITVGSLFSGIGGFDLGLERAGMEVLWQVEYDEQAQAVLRHHWPNVEIHKGRRIMSGKFYDENSSSPCGRLETRPRPPSPTAHHTTGMVALRLHRSFIGIELNPEYVKLARERIIDDMPLFNIDRESGEAA